MKINRMHKGNYGKIKAFFDVETSEGFIIKGFKIIEGDGLFVGMPSVKDKEGEYQNTVYMSKEDKVKFTKLAVDFYNDNKPDAYNQVPDKKELKDLF
tara:strand:- start:290 stop:580 length:291 start_codon:yes stop_codon:yes gene_type:complete